MIHSLEFRGGGPATRLGPIHFRERLNLLTGDNGLGKTFVLDTAWWALTGTWPDALRAALPAVGSQDPTIVAKIEAKTRAPAWESTFNFALQGWPLPKGRPANPGLVLYFRVDGQFSLWDPTVHYSTGAVSAGDLPSQPSKDLARRPA